MNRRLILAAGTMALAGVAVLPATAAPKAKPFKGSYAVTLNPDPTGNITGSVPLELFGKGCNNLIDASKHEKALSIPGKGTLKVTLISPDPTGAGVTDWDLYILSADKSEEIDVSAGETSNEGTATKFTKATKIIINVCNLAGMPDATVTYSYKPS